MNESCGFQQDLYCKVAFCKTGSLGVSEEPEFFRRRRFEIPDLDEL
jgi:hypothetical protein